LNIFPPKAIFFSFLHAFYIVLFKQKLTEISTFSDYPFAVILLIFFALYGHYALLSNKRNRIPAILLLNEAIAFFYR